MENLEDRERIYELFHHRCILCRKWSVDIHEIDPRSSGKKSMRLENRVVLCYRHHTWAHRIGASKSAPLLREMRNCVLERYNHANNE